MENLKVFISNEEDSKKAQELFSELGYSFSMLDFCEDSNSFQVFDDCSGSLFSDHDTCSHKEITIPQLRDMVVLKRNDVRDANAYCHDNNEHYYITSEGEYFYYLIGYSGNKWMHSSNDISYLQSHVKPIEKPMSETEYLMQGKNGERLMESVGRLKGVDATLAERQSQYGSFTCVANTTGQLMGIIKNSKNGSTLPYAHEEALHMICSKIARIVNGDYNFLDNWHDIGGYSKLIENLIEDKNASSKD